MNYALNSPIATQEQMPFIRKTYAWFAYTLGIGAITATISFNVCLPFLAQIFAGYAWLGIMAAYMVIGFLFARFVVSENRTTAFAGMTAFAALEGALFGPLIGAAFLVTGGLHIVGYALLVTGAVFGSLTALVFFSKANLTWMGTGLWVISWAFLAVIVLGCIVGFGSVGSLVITGFGILLMCGWTLYDTSKILHKYGEGDEMLAATMLHIDFATLLWYILLWMMWTPGGDAV